MSNTDAYLNRIEQRLQGIETALRTIAKALEKILEDRGARKG